MDRYINESSRTTKYEEIEAEYTASTKAMHPPKITISLIVSIVLPFFDHDEYSTGLLSALIIKFLYYFIT